MHSQPLRARLSFPAALFVAATLAFLACGCSTSAVSGSEVIQSYSDGSRLAATYLRPRSPDREATFLLLHEPGAGRDRHDFDDIWPALESYGIGILVPDLRSHGASDDLGSLDELLSDPEGYPADVRGWLGFLERREAEGDLIDLDRIGVLGLGASGSLAAATVGAGLACCAVAVSPALQELVDFAPGLLDEGGDAPGDDDDSAGGPSGDDDAAAGVVPGLSLRDTRWIYGADDQPAATDAPVLRDATEGQRDLVSFEGELHGVEILWSSSEAKESIVSWCLDLL